MFPFFGERRVSRSSTRRVAVAGCPQKWAGVGTEGGDSPPVIRREWGEKGVPNSWRFPVRAAPWDRSILEGKALPGSGAQRSQIKAVSPKNRSPGGVARTQIQLENPHRQPGNWETKFLRPSSASGALRCLFLPFPEVSGAEGFSPFPKTIPYPKRL